MEQKSVHAINKIFSAAAIRELAASQKSSYLKDIEPVLQMAGLDGATVRDAFAWAQKKLAGSYRSEYFYKSILVEKIVRGVHSPNTMAVYSEFRVGLSRADLVLINGDATVYEIKTEMDDLSKAEKQVAEYFSCFKKVVFVVDERHIDGVIAILPRQVGISSICARSRIKIVRAPAARSDLINSRALFSCMHRSEYERLLDDFASPELDRNSYAKILGFIDKMPVDDLYAYFVKMLRERKLAGRRVKDMRLLPPSLWAAAYSHKLKVGEWNGLIKALDRDVRDFI
jgi:hypothetical protein